MALASFDSRCGLKSSRTLTLADVRLGTLVPKKGLTGPDEGAGAGLTVDWRGDLEGAGATTAALGRDGEPPS